MAEQKFKITNQSTGTDTFFCDQNGKTAMENAEDYITRNQGKFPMTLYFRSSKPKPFPLWDYMRFIPENTPATSTSDTPAASCDTDAACCACGGD